MLFNVNEVKFLQEFQYARKFVNTLCFTLLVHVLVRRYGSCTVSHLL